VKELIATSLDFFGGREGVAELLALYDVTVLRHQKHSSKSNEEENKSVFDTNVNKSVQVPSDQTSKYPIFPLP
jgi:hypothetical protein